MSIKKVNTKTIASEDICKTEEQKIWKAFFDIVLNDNKLTNIRNSPEIQVDKGEKDKI